MKQYIKNKLWIIAFAIILIFILKTDFSYIISKILSVLLPVVISLILAWILVPLKTGTEGLCRKLLSKRLSHIISAFTIYFAFVGLLVFFITYLVPIMKSGITNLYNIISSYYYEIKNRPGKSIIDDIINMINPNIYITSAKNTISVITDIAMSMLFLIYVLLEHRQLKSFCVELTESVIGIERTEKLIFYISKTNRIFLNYFLGKSISSALLGMLTIVGLLFAKIKYAVFFGIIIALSNFIPIFGAILVCVPISLYALSEYGIAKTLTVIGIIIISQQIENVILTPRIVGNTIGMSGFWVLLSVVLGGGLFGFWGMLLSIPIFATIKMLYLEATDKKHSFNTDTHKNI